MVALTCPEIAITRACKSLLLTSGTTRCSARILTYKSGSRSRQRSPPRSQDFWPPDHRQGTFLFHRHMILNKSLSSSWGKANVIKRTVFIERKGTRGRGTAIVLAIKSKDAKTIFSDFRQPFETLQKGEFTNPLNKT